MKSFVERKINVQIALDGDTFEGSSNVIDLSGLRVQATIQSYSGSIGSFASQMQMRISGMKNADMAKLSTLGFSSATYTKNFIKVAAGDDVNGMAYVFSGGIVCGNVDYNSMPDVGIEIVASALANFQYNPIAANSWKGDQNVAAMLQSIALSAGMKFQDGGVTAVLSNHAVGGTATEQIEDICTASGTQHQIKDGTLSIWPASSYQRSVIALDVGPDTGMVGYPRYIMSGIEVTSLFLPTAEVGQQINVKSSTPAPAANAPHPFGGAPAGANGSFYCFGVTHDLASQTLGGPWFTTLQLSDFPNQPR